MKPNITLVTLISEKDKARIVNTLFKAKLLTLVGQLATLLKRNFPYALFYVNFHSNRSSLFLLVAGSERVYRKASLSNTRKASQFLCALQAGFSKKIENVQEKCQCRCPVSLMLACNFIKTGLHHGCFLEMFRLSSGSLFVY